MDLHDQMPSSGEILEDGSQWDTSSGYHLMSVVSLTAQCPITCISFDPVEDLVWAANVNGRVASFTGPQLDRYTAYAAANTDIRALEAAESCVLALSSTHLKVNTKQGLHCYQYGTQNMYNMTALHRLPEAPNSIIMGGEQTKIIQFDIEAQKEKRTTNLKNAKNAIIIRSNGKYIFTGDTDGNVSVRASGNMECIHRIAAHGGPLADFDVCGNNLITCGWSMRMNTMHGDPYVKVYDLRMFSALQPIPLAFAPTHTRFLPTYCDSKMVIVSQMGQVQVMDVNERAGSPFLIDTGGLPVYGFHFSPSKQVLGFGDELGTVYIFGDRPEAVFIENPWPTEFADPPLGPPQSFNITDDSTPLAAVPLPFSTDDSFLSDWPEDLCVPTYRKPRPLATSYPGLRMVQFVGYAPNPRMSSPFKHFNIVPYILDEDEKEEEKLKEEWNVDEGVAHLIPSFYRRLNLKRAKFAADDRHLERFNRTELTCLESNSGSGFANPMFLLLYWVTALRNLFLSHVCEVDPCICCELGFLFRILTDQKESHPASSNNMMRALRGSQFIANEMDCATSKVHKLFQCMIHLFIERFSFDERCRLKNLIETGLSVNARCIRCSEVTSHETETLAITLNYPSGAERFGVCNLIEKALMSREQSEKECRKCGSVTQAEFTKKVRSLPPVLLIDTNPDAAGFMQFWEAQTKAHERRPHYKKPEVECSVEGGRNERQCRYGAECRHRPFCKYSHGGADWEAEMDTWLEVEEVQAEWSHVIPAIIERRLNQGIVILSSSSQATACKDTAKYRLIAMIMGIADAEGMWTHSVVEVRDSKLEGGWYVLNDLAGTRVGEHEALHIDTRWKLPLVMAYVREDLCHLEESGRVAVPDSVFHTDTNLTGNEEVARDRRTRNIPSSGEVVALDAEFININKDAGRKSIARLSCVDADGEVLIDDYVTTCAGDIVDDYLTQYSGIKEDDLDPIKSTKHLSTLKRVYLKILHLIQKGVVFVGHGLINDFSALNVHVPPSQILDTVQLFRIPQGRMISLQFLAWHLLNEKIQEGTHDSVEDARIALKLFRKWEFLKAEGTMDQVIRHLYDTGKNCSWRLGEVPFPVELKSETLVDL